MKLVGSGSVCYSVHPHPRRRRAGELVLYKCPSVRLHLRTVPSLWEQLELLRADMQAEYEKGKLVHCRRRLQLRICWASRRRIFGGSAEGYTWAQPLPEGIWDGTNLSLGWLLLDEVRNPVPSVPQRRTVSVITRDIVRD